MKKLIIAVSLAVASSFVLAETKTPPQPVKTKKVCKTGKDGKETCKVIKVRKKLEGKPIPK